MTTDLVSHSRGRRVCAARGHLPPLSEPARGASELDKLAERLDEELGVSGSATGPTPTRGSEGQEPARDSAAVEPPREPEPEFGEAAEEEPAELLEGVQGLWELVVVLDELRADPRLREAVRGVVLRRDASPEELSAVVTRIRRMIGPAPAETKALGPQGEAASLEPESGTLEPFFATRP